MCDELTGLTAIVTGGASGIGAAVTRRLLAKGAAVGVFDLNVSEVPDGALRCTVNVGDDTTVVSGVEATAARFGGIDIIVNCAAISSQGTIADNTDDEWMRAFDINVLGIVRVARAALPWLRASAAASIVNIGSVASTTGIQQRALYGATKGAVSSLSLQMAADHLHDGIRVNCVNPGTADTPWVARLLASAEDPIAERRALEARQPHGRLVSPEEVADAVVYLVGPLAGSTTGSTIAVDGGMHNLRVRPRQST